MIIITQSYNNRVISIETFSPEKVAIEHFLQIVSEEGGEKITFSDDVFLFQTIDSSFGTSISYESRRACHLAVQLFGIKDIEKYARYWILYVYLKSGAISGFHIKNKSKKKAIEEADNIIKDIDPEIVSGWTLTPKNTF